MVCRQVLAIIVRLARYGSPVQYCVSSTDRWSVRADDPNVGEVSETVCRETPPNMELVPGISGICSKQRYQRGYRLQSILSQFRQPPLSTFSFHARRGVSSQVEAVQTMVDRMKTALEEAQANLTVAQSRAKSQVDRWRRNEKFEVGDEVVLSTCHISVNQSLPSKLRKHWIGPYRVTSVISPVAYRLDLPPAWRIHSVFHVSNLKRFQRSKEFEREERPPSPVVVDGVEEYEVEAILRHKGKRARRLYLSDVEGISHH